MPASIIVANWREKIWSDFGLIALNTPADAEEPASFTRSICCASRPFERSCSSAAREVGSGDRAVDSIPFALIAV